MTDLTNHTPAIIVNAYGVVESVRCDKLDVKDSRIGWWTTVHHTALCRDFRNYDNISTQRGHP